MQKALIVLALAVCLSIVSADIHAVLIAGSNGFWNYRHQADICHAYHTLIKKGVPAENIITLAYDDVANDESNPFPGQIFNKPNGTDHYAGCKIDYKGDDVNADNFLAVLTGNKTAAKGKRVLNSTHADEVFINFADHGGTGLIAVIDDYLYADDLIKALKTMHSKKMYNKLVFYMEACESGSMFADLPTNISIYAATAANADESSWGCYCPPNDVVNGKEINSCLGDTFSVSWLENSDANNLTAETLKEQFEEILPLVNQSHPQQFGDLTWLNESVADFIGNSSSNSLHRSLNGFPVISGQEDTRNAKLVSMKAKYERNPTEENFEAYIKEIKSIQYFDNTFEHIESTLGHELGSLQSMSVTLPQDLSCLKKAVQSYERICTKFSDYGLKYTRTLAHLCYTHQLTDFDALLTKVCDQEELISLIH